MSRRLQALAGAALITLAAIQPAYAQLRGGFSVSGKKGTYLKQIAGKTLDQSGGGAGSMGLAADAINRGEFQTARLRMPQTEARIAALLSKIESAWPYDKSRPVKVMIIGVDHYNAYALPDGSIMVAFGLLEQVKSDDELAFILSHELGHIRLGHFAEGAALDKKAETSRMGALFAIGAVAGGVATGGGIDISAAGRQAQATNDLLHFMNTAMVGPAHSRDQEDQSDAIGFDLSNLADYSAESASAKVFDTIQADEQRRGAITDALNGQLKTELGRAVRDGSLLNAAMGGEVSTMGVLKGVGRIGLGVARNADASGPKHRSPEERKKGIANYSADAYPQGLPLRDEQTSWISQTRGAKEYADGKVAVDAIAKAMRLRADAKYADAEAALKPALAGPFGAAPVVTNLSANLRDDQADTVRADALFHQAHQSPDQTVDGYVDHVRMLYRVKRANDALTVTDQGITRFGNDDKPFIALIIGINKQAGRGDETDRWLKRCLNYGDSGLTKDCNLAAGKKPGEVAEQNSGGKAKMPSLGGLGGIGKIGGFGF